MQDEEVHAHRAVLARDIAVGIQVHRRAALVGDAVGHREHVLVVDGDDAGEDKALAIVPAQGDGIAGAQHLAGRQLPVAVLARHVVAADPAEFGIVRIVGALGRQQHDLRALGIDRVVIFLQAQVIQARAAQQDRTVHHRGVDIDARAADFQRGRQRHVGRARRHAGQARRRGVGGGAGGGRLGLGLLGQFGLARLFGLHRRCGDEILPEEQHRSRQRDGEKDILLIVHLGPKDATNVCGERDRSPTNRRARKWDGSAPAALQSATVP